MGVRSLAALVENSDSSVHGLNDLHWIRHFPAFFSCFPSGPVSVHGGGVSDIPGQSGSPAVLPGVFSQLPGSCLIGVSHFPDSGPEVLRSSFPGPSSSSHLGRDVSGPLSQR